MLTDLKVKVGPAILSLPRRRLSFGAVTFQEYITPNEFWWCMAPYP